MGDGSNVDDKHNDSDDECKVRKRCAMVDFMQSSSHHLNVKTVIFCISGEHQLLSSRASSQRRSSSRHLNIKTVIFCISGEHQLLSSRVSSQRRSSSRHLNIKTVIFCILGEHQLLSSRASSQRPHGHPYLRLWLPLPQHHRIPHQPLDLLLAGRHPRGHDLYGGGWREPADASDAGSAGIVWQRGQRRGGEGGDGVPATGVALVTGSQVHGQHVWGDGRLQTAVSPDQRGLLQLLRHRWLLLLFPCLVVCFSCFVQSGEHIC